MFNDYLSNISSPQRYWVPREIMGVEHSAENIWEPTGHMQYILCGVITLIFSSWFPDYGNREYICMMQLYGFKAVCVLLDIVILIGEPGGG